MNEGFTVMEVGEDVLLESLRASGSGIPNAEQNSDAPSFYSTSTLEVVDSSGVCRRGFAFEDRILFCGRSEVTISYPA